MTKPKKDLYSIKIRHGLVNAQVYVIRRPGETLITWTAFSLDTALQWVAQDIRDTRRRRTHTARELPDYVVNV